MILQALNRYYDALAAKGKAPAEGFAPQKCAFALLLDDDGRLVAAESLMTEEERGKKKVMAPRELIVPEPCVRSSGVAAQFLCDHCGYVLGMDGKGDAKRAADCRAAFRALHHRLLDGCDSPAAKAVLAFLDRGDAPEYEEILAPVRDELLKGGNLVFRYRGQFVHDDPQIRAAWTEKRERGEDGRVMTCLVTGGNAPAVGGHAKIKGVRNASTMGASLIAYNDYDSAESYGLSAYENSPVSAKASFAFTTALNALLADSRHLCLLGDATVVYWSEDADEQAQEMFGLLMEPPDHSEADERLHGVMELIRKGKMLADTRVDAPFYVLALSPNAGRVSVRFFLRDTFGGMAKHLQAHYDRLQIAHAPGETAYLSPRRLMRETANLHERDSDASPPLAGAFLRAVLTDGRYPEELLAAVMARVRVTRDDPDRHIYRVTYGRAALIKAFLLKNTNADREVLDVALNREATNKPYLLGRMFSVLEQIQQAANPGVNTTVKDRYFASACATPGVVFPQLLRLSGAHMGKLNVGAGVYFGKMLGEIMDKLDVTNAPFPPQLSLEDQGLFFLGYYQQNQARYEKKEDQ